MKKIVSLKNEFIYTRYIGFAGTNEGELTLGERYTVKRIEQKRFITYFYLKGYGNKRFNSLCFSK